jgi:hypothetical protein
MTHATYYSVLLIAPAGNKQEYITTTEADARSYARGIIEAGGTSVVVRAVRNEKRADGLPLVVTEWADPIEEPPR